ncbi:hypothetical protein AAG570_003136 [Ranatra chinensis]|uniref:Uncharacterized protein n=1 Tax=Ranatra chinensis TaxID=642074 RepID=A0ABD0Y5W7_9HEMI
MDSRLPSFLRNNFICFVEKSEPEPGGDSSGYLFVHKSGELVEVVCPFVGRKLKFEECLGRVTQNSKILRFISYYPLVINYLVSVGDVVYVIECDKDLRVVKKFDDVIGVEVADLCRIGRPLVSLKFRNRGKQELLDVNKGLHYFGNSETDQIRIGDLPIQLCINESETFLTKRIRINQKLIMFLKGICKRCLFAPSEIKSLEYLMYDFNYWRCLETPGKCTVKLSLGDPWTLTLENKLIVGVPLKNISWNAITDLEVYLYKPSVKYRTVLLMDKAESGTSYVISSSLSPRSRGVLMLLFDIDELQMTNFLVSSVILYDKLKVQSTLNLEVKLLELMKVSDEISFKSFEKEVIMVLIATAISEEIIFYFPNSESVLMNTLQKFGFNTTINGFLIFPPDSSHILRCSVIKVCKKSSFENFIKLVLYCRDECQYSLLVTILQNILSKGGFQLLPKEKELHQGLIMCLTQELKCLRSYLIDTLPRLEMPGGRAKSTFSLDVNKYLKLLEFEKYTDIALSNYSKSKMLFEWES